MGTAWRRERRGANAGVALGRGGAGRHWRLRPCHAPDPMGRCRRRHAGGRPPPDDDRSPGSGHLARGRRLSQIVDPTDTGGRGTPARSVRRRLLAGRCAAVAAGDGRALRNHDGRVGRRRRGVGDEASTEGEWEKNNQPGQAHGKSPREFIEGNAEVRSSRRRPATKQVMATSDRNPDLGTGRRSSNSSFRARTARNAVPGGRGALWASRRTRAPGGRCAYGTGTIGDWRATGPVR